MEISEQRIDNWLYRLRFTKTRTISQNIIKDGNVRINKFKIYNYCFHLILNNKHTKNETVRVFIIESFI